MKKMMKSIAAIALMLFAASCSKEMIETPAVNEGEALVSFSIATPGLMTRALADGNTVDKVSCNVYNADGTLISDATVSKTLDMTNGSTNFSVRLMTGQTYSFIFWAYKAPTGGTTSPYTFSAADKTVTVSYANAVSNDESRDAFYAYVEPVQITGSLTQEIKLHRPFAQLNFGVNKDDITAAETLGITVSKSSLTIKNLGTTLNLVSGEVTGATEATFSAAAVLSEGLKVNNVDYGYVSMNYVLVGKSAKATADAALTLYKTENESDVIVNTISLPNLPLQGNYRTNVLGNLFTSQTEYSIEVNSAFTADDNVDYPAADTNTSNEDV